MSTFGFVSLRDLTASRINDLLGDEGVSCAASQNLLTYFVGVMPAYKEEGVNFSPNVIFCDSIADFIKSFPGTVLHNIGELPLDADSGSKILKDCAPLSSENWSIYIERQETGKTIKYGIFSYLNLPTSIPLHEGITLNSNIFSLLLRKTSVNSIEIIGSKGNKIIFSFSTKRSSTTSIGNPIEDFAKDCCRDFPETDLNDSFASYMSRLLDSSLNACHGTILSCGKKVDLSTISELRDAVLISPSMDFGSAFSNYHKSSTAESILALQRCESLLNGFLRCDGIILFDTRGCVTAYRIFYGTPASPITPTKKIVGGARRRAFEGLKDIDRNIIQSILFRSQDGTTIYHKV